MSLFSLSQRSYSLEELTAQPLIVGERRLELHAHEHLSEFELKEEGSGRLIKRGHFNSSLNQLTLKPTLLNRPLVLALDHPLHILPRASCELRLARPLAFEIEAHADADPLRLCASSTRSLRLTSYGQVTSPMLCYHWVSPVNVQLASGDEALVPLTVHNQTKQTVELRKVILYKSFLKLFRGEAQFVTNQVDVNITSKSEAYLEYAHAPPSALKSFELVFDPKHEGELPLLKILRLVSKRGTGIEYGF